MKKTWTKILFLAVFVGVAFANTSGPNFPATTGGWTNNANISATDGVYATSGTIATVSTSIQLNASNFGFAIPAGATITGITATVIGHGAVALVIDFGDNNAKGAFPTGAGVQLTKVANTGTGTAIQDAGQVFAATDGTFNFSGVLWGTTWAPSDINSTGFGVIMKVENTDSVGRVASIDSVTITVTFTPAATAKSGFLQMFTRNTMPQVRTQTRSFSPGGKERKL